MKRANDCAFPVIIDDVSTKQFSDSGLSVREHFAGLAMNGFASLGRGNSREMAEASVMLADALIRELAKQKEL